MSKARRTLKYGAFGLGGFVVLLVMFALVMFLLRSKWELYGNFLPYFNFESTQEHSERVAKRRAPGVPLMQLGSAPSPNEVRDRFGRSLFQSASIRYASKLN